MEYERLEILFDLVINNMVLNFEILTGYGYTAEELKWMKEHAVLTKCKNGTYKFLAIDKLRRYGLKLLYERCNAKDANACFRKCYELAPTNRKVCMQYMIALLKRNDYQEALKVYDSMVRKTSNKYTKDNNLYLLLFSVLTDLDTEKAEKVTSFKPYDILLTRHVEHKDENDMRKAILNSKYTYAYQLNNLRACNDKGGYSVKLELIKCLLAHAIEAERKFKNTLLELTRKQEYGMILLLLCKREQQKNLSRLENYIMIVCDSIIRLKETGEVPEVTVYNTDKMYEALLGNNFGLALQLNREFLLNDGADPDTDIVNILLIDINNIINDNIESQKEKYLSSVKKRTLKRK